MTFLYKKIFVIEETLNVGYLETAEVPGLENLPRLLHGGGEGLRLVCRCHPRCQPPRQAARVRHSQAGRPISGPLPGHINIGIFRRIWFAFRLEYFMKIWETALCYLVKMGEDSCVRYRHRHNSAYIKVKRCMNKWKLLVREEAPCAHSRSDNLAKCRERKTSAAAE